jgi:hypothetical protein
LCVFNIQVAAVGTDASQGGVGTWGLVGSVVKKVVCVVPPTQAVVHKAGAAVGWLTAKLVGNQGEGGKGKGKEEEGGETANAATAVQAVMKKKGRKRRQHRRRTMRGRSNDEASGSGDEPEVGPSDSMGPASGAGECDKAKIVKEAMDTIIEARKGEEEEDAVAARMVVRESDWRLSPDEWESYAQLALAGGPGEDDALDKGTS